jgi:flagellar hook-length control protein FliK
MAFDANEEASGTFDTKKEDKIYSQTVLNNFMIMMNYNFNNEKINIEKLPTEESEMQVGILPMNVKEPNNLQMPQSKTNDTFDFSKVVTKDSILKSNYNVEKLVAEIEGNSEKQKNEFNFNVETQMPKEYFINGDNKIITLSDESSRIKSQVLSQLKDKIVFHTEKAPTSKNEIKHVTMELQPHNLGKVDVKITFQDNKITVEIKALNEETQKILSSNAGELANILNKSTESSINIVVKNSELQHERQQLSYNQSQEQSYNESYDQNDGHGRQRGFYYKENKNKDSDEDSTFTELINLRNLKSI